MTMIRDKETEKYEPITRPEDIPAVSWAEVMACGGDKEKLDKLWKRGNAEKDVILKELKKRGRETVEGYYAVKKEMGL